MATDKDKVRLKYNIIKIKWNMCDFGCVRICHLKRGNNLLFHSDRWNARRFHSVEWFRCVCFVSTLWQIFLWACFFCRIGNMTSESEEKKKSLQCADLFDWDDPTLWTVFIRTHFAATSITASKDFVMINGTFKCKYTQTRDKSHKMWLAPQQFLCHVSCSLSFTFYAAHICHPKKS